MSHAMQCRSGLNRSALKQARRTRELVELLEPRTLLSSTLFVTPSTVPTDSTHFQSLQSALAFANAGDTVVLQQGMAAGSFATTVLNGAVSAGGTVIQTAGPLAVSEIVSIGGGTASDPIERDLVTSVTQTLLGGYMIGLASPLQFDHDSSAVDANNPTNGGPSIGVSKGVTITTDSSTGITLPFNIEMWPGTTGGTIAANIFTPSSPAPLPTPPVTPASETINVTAASLGTVQGGFTCGAVAHFTDTAKHKTSDFTATVTFSDGTTAKGFVCRTWNGAFEVIAPHRFSTAGTVNFTVTVTSKTGGSGAGGGAVTVMPRHLNAQGVNVTTDAKVLNLPTVATFTDNLHCTWPQNYKATITWSDGLITTGQIFWNWWGGGFSVTTSRNLSGPGTLTGTVTISTGDGLVSTTTSFALTVTAPPPPSASGGRGCRW